MPTVQNAIAPLKKTGAIVETGLANGKYNAKCWALQEILDRATKPEKVTEPALEKVGAAGPSASSESVWVETDLETAIEPPEEQSMSNAIPVQNDRKPRAGTVEHDLMQSQKLIERLEKLAEKQSEDLRAATSVKNNELEAILKCMMRLESGFLGSVNIIADEMGKMRAGNEHVEASIRELLEELNKADVREAAALSRGFAQGWREAMKAIREDLREGKSAPARTGNENVDRIHNAVQRAAEKAKKQVMRDITELFPGLNIADVVVIDG
jgi:hypothetical protein